MGLADVLRSGVATANSVTSDLQAGVTLAPWIGFNKKGGSNEYGLPVPYSAVVELKTRQRRLADGTIITQKATVQFLVPVAPTVAAGRKNPIDPRDRITLSTGYTGPILDVGGVEDPSTNAPYAAEVILG